MKGVGRPKKAAKKLNFNKRSGINTKQEILPTVDDKDTFRSPVIAIPIQQDDSIEPVTSTSSSNMNNNDFVPVTNDIIDRKFPIKLENNAQVCFFNSICQICLSSLLN